MIYKWMWLLLVGLLFLSEKKEVQAAVVSESVITMLDEVNFSDLNAFLKEEELLEEFDFKELVRKLMQGEEIDKGLLFKQGKNILLQEISTSRTYMTQIILLMAAFALLYNFANVFQNAAVTDVSFYMVYMILLALLMNSFMLMSGVLENALDKILGFMQVLMPAFSLTIVLSTGTITAMGFHQLTMFLIYLIEVILLYVVLPAVHIYIVLELLNHMTKEEMLSKMTELIKIMVEWMLKALFALVLGLNLVQGLLSPVIDNLKSNMLVKTVGVIPGLGGSIQAATEIMISSGIIIKNGVGVAGILILLILCASPLLKVGIMALLYKISAAVIQPIADKRLAGCVSGMGEGARLLGKTLLMAEVMLILTIVLVIAATTWNK